MATSHPEMVDHHRKLFPATIYGLGEWRRYNAGIWEALPELAVRLEIQQIGRRVDIAVNNGMVTSVLELLRAFVHKRDELFDADSSILTFDDCTLELATRTARALSESDLVTTKLPFAYDPTATSTEWNNFLATTVPEYTSFLQEYAGYCLTPSTRYETALWLWGPPGGGKSTFIEGLRSMLGHRCCVLGLSEISQSRFALSQLPGKTMAISTEQPGGFVKSTERINSIISGEPIPVDRKFREQIIVVPRAKIIWGMNELPRIDSSGVGLFRRVIPIHFPAILPELRDPAVKEAILNSGMAIVNWALDGLVRLTDRQAFEIPAKLVEEREIYRIQNDIPQLFIEECCEKVEGARIRSSALYSVYTGWCARNHHGTQSSTTWAAEMKRLGISKLSLKDGNYWEGLEIRVQPAIDLSKYDDLTIN